MSERKVAELYDSLHAFESRYKTPGAYPVHKRLRFDGSSARDIYDWIASRVDVRAAGNVLDAGCGVGFGTLLLAERGTASVTGISLSELELARARRAAVERGLANRATFRLQSFDELPESAYGLVIAVESLKHSPDLARSLGSITRALADGATLVVVEDLAAVDADDADARGLAQDWGLARLHAEEDYLVPLGRDRCTTVDLTSAVPRASRLELAAKLATLNAAATFGPASRSRLIRAFRGGLRLEKLYARGAMAYKAIFYRRPERASR